mmetsp:Transcript_49932/g.132734  ORF Transcript_49932/g.132734 Transcript_49932/m.132734 type:complete len:224 (+) Transcript_49932:732-1403(+)
MTNEPRVSSLFLDSLSPPPYAEPCLSPERHHSYFEWRSEVKHGTVAWLNNETWDDGLQSLALTFSSPLVQELLDVLIEALLVPTTVFQDPPVLFEDQVPLAVTQMCGLHNDVPGFIAFGTLLDVFNDFVHIPSVNGPLRHVQHRHLRHAEVVEHFAEDDFVSESLYGSLSIAHFLHDCYDLVHTQIVSTGSQGVSEVEVCVQDETLCSFQPRPWVLYSAGAQV